MEMQVVGPNSAVDTTAPGRMSRRFFFEKVAKGATALATGVAILSQPGKALAAPATGIQRTRPLIPYSGIPRAITSAPFLGIPRSILPGPLFGIPRAYQHLPVANFPGHYINPSSRPVQGGPFGFYGSYFPLLYPSIYRGVSPFRKLTQSGSCFQCEEPTNYNANVRCTNVGYMESVITEKDKAALEALREDTLSSLVRNGYSIARNDQRQIINTDEQLRYYLTPIILAHAVYNEDTLEAIAKGLNQQDPDLIETYGSLEFFQDAIGAINCNDRLLKLYKIDLATLSSNSNPKPNPANDIYNIINDLNEIQKETRSKQGYEKFTIGNIKEKAEYIVRIYHCLTPAERDLIIDGLIKSGGTEAERRQISMEQSLLMEPLKGMGQEILGPDSLKLCFKTLKELQEQRAKRN